MITRIFYTRQMHSAEKLLIFAKNRQPAVLTLYSTVYAGHVLSLSVTKIPYAFKSRTYFVTVTSTPALTGSDVMRRFRLFLGQCSDKSLPSSQNLNENIY